MSFPRAAFAQCGDIIFSDASSVTAADLSDTAKIEQKFMERVAATELQSSACGLAFNDSCGRRDIGQAFHHRLFAHLASSDPAKRQAAHDFLRGLQRDQFGEMGTTAPLGDVCETTVEDVLTFLPDLATNLGRHGEADVAMIGLVTALHKYQLPDDVEAHVLSLIDEEPGIGGVETVSFGLSTGAIVTICGSACALTCTNPVSCAACAVACGVALEGESVEAPETENHLNMIYVSQYLANQKRFERTGDPKYDNARNGYRQKLISRMRAFVRNDFIEYNSHPYQRYTMFALLSLASFATDPAVKDAARAALDYVSAKVAVSSSDLIRSTPFRRKDNSNYVCDDLYDKCADPQTTYFMMLAGNLDIIPQLTEPDGKVVRKALAGSAENFGWVAATNYRVDPLVLDLFVDRSHRKFYQFIYSSRVIQLDGAQDSHGELYYGSPSFLLSAGGRPGHFAYTADVPVPASLLVGEHPGADIDRGATVPTTLLPTGDGDRSRDRSKLIRFHVKDGENMCVAPNFACGLNPVVPDSYSADLVAPGDVQAAGLDPARWSIVNRKASAGPYGYYAAVYREGDFGLLEVYDTFLDPQAVTDVADFMRRVKDNNGTRTFTRAGVNTYKTIDGKVLEFGDFARIVTVDGVRPIRDRTNGDVINNDGKGTVTITNPGLPGRALTLNATIPPDRPMISVPGPIHFPNTCLGTTSYETLDVCNVNTGSEDLFVYNIVPKNAQFGAREPTSGYPLSVSPDFCYPFQVNYTPTVYGSLTSSLAISNSDPAQDPLRLEVTGNAPSGKVSVSGSGAFGNVCAGSNAQTRITVANTGGCPLRITGVSVDDGAGAACAEFAVANGPFPDSLAAGSSLPISVAFTPTSGGTKSCRLVVASDDPATPTASVPLSATTPPVNLLVPAVAGFPPTVVQSVGACTSQNPFPVVNNGLCPVAVRSVTLGGTNPSDYFTSGLPSLTSPLQAGHVLGEGSLNIGFKPTVLPLTRADTATISVTYENDPITRTTATVAQPLCGEDVTRGARVLVTNAATGEPLPVVERIQISRIGSNRRAVSIDNATAVPLQPAVTQASPCASFRYHREWGGASNPVQLTAGDYQVTVTAVSPKTGKRATKTVSFTLGTCGFNPNVVVPF